MIEADAVGEELIRRGWCQGSLLPAVSAQKSWLVVKSLEGTSPTWRIQQELVEENDLLLIVSQTCDINRSLTQEPYVEAVRAYWTDDRSVIHEAGKNSVRRFLVFRSTTSLGTLKGLIADATIRVQIKKVALLQFTPLQVSVKIIELRNAVFGNGWLKDIIALLFQMNWLLHYRNLLLRRLENFAQQMIAIAFLTASASFYL